MRRSMITLSGRGITNGIAIGKTLVSKTAMSFFGGVDPDTGIIVEHGHELEGQSIRGKIFVFTTGKGSTVGSYILYRMKKTGTAPLAIINVECEPIIAVGCILAEIPCVDHIEIEKIENNSILQVNGETGIVCIL